MNENKNSNISGIGYASIMMIFVVTCLTVFAVLSFRSANSTKELNIKSRKFMTEYYKADTEAKKTLMMIDNSAFKALQSGFFDDELFIDSLSENDLTDSTVTSYGYNVSYTVSVNDKLELYVLLAVFSNPSSNSDDNERFDILKWKLTEKESLNKTDDNKLNVWDGSFE